MTYAWQWGAGLEKALESKEFLLNKTYEPKGLQQSVCLSFTTFNPYQLCSQMWPSGAHRHRCPWLHAQRADAASPTAHLPP